MKICILGCGNMMSAVIIPIASKFSDLEFYTYTPSFTKAQSMAKKISGHAIKNIEDIPECDLYFIGCKPQQVSQLSKSINLKNKSIISILAGVSVNQLKILFKTDRILRVMPNTPSLIGKGISLLYGPAEFKAEGSLYTDSKEWLKTIGVVIEVKSEKKLDEITLISGSGPAYLFKLAEALYSKCVDLGLDDKTSRILVDNLLVGSSQLMKDEPLLSYKEQIAKVCSKGGVTQKAVEKMDANSFDQLMSQSIDAGIEHYKELSKL